MTPEYDRLGCLPADQFLPDLMEHLGEPYYVGLLTAAAYHCASHHAPWVFQVVVPNSRRDIRCGSVSVVFVARGDMSATSTVERNTPTGMIRISSPEALAPWKPVTGKPRDPRWRIAVNVEVEPDL